MRNRATRTFTVGFITEISLLPPLKTNAKSGHIINKILPLWTPDANCPELHHLDYAIRAAIVPTIVLDQVPQILTLLAHVDGIRQLFLRRLSEMRELDDSFKKADPRGLRALSEDERVLLDKLSVRMDGRMRASYRELVGNFSLHVCVRVSLLQSLG